MIERELISNLQADYLKQTLIKHHLIFDSYTLLPNHRWLMITCHVNKYLTDNIIVSKHNGTYCALFSPSWNGLDDSNHCITRINKSLSSAVLSVWHLIMSYNHNQMTSYEHKLDWKEKVVND